MEDHKSADARLRFKVVNQANNGIVELVWLKDLAKEAWRFSPIMLQNTGIADSAGEEIYEHDIMLTHTGIAVVVWDRGGWALKTPGSGAVDWEQADKMATYTVMCNIHDIRYKK